VIDVIDDGRGIDIEAVRKKVVQMGMMDEKAAAGLNNETLLEYLYLPGFSTATQTSATSGRGVGLDVVRTVMNEINGETHIQTESGKGTTFSFVFPMVTAVNISDVLMVKCNNTHFAFPILSVVTSQLVPKSDVTITTGKGRSIVYLGKILALFDLLEVLGEPPVKIEDDKYPVIIVEYKNRLVAFIVSDFLSPQKIVITEFDDNMVVPGLKGTAILSGRQMGMVIDLPTLFEQTFGTKHQAKIRSMFSEGAGGLSDIDSQAQEITETDESSIQPVESAGEDTVPEDSEGFGFGSPDSEFLKEVESMLNRLNRELLTLEENRDSETADGIFRLVHSIKGNLTMYGAEKPASITHKIETILEQARRGAIELDDKAFDVLFDGSSYLEEVVGALLKSGKAPAASEKLLAGIAAFEKQDQKERTGTEVVDIDNAQVELDPTGEFYLSSRRREGAVVYQCRIDFDPGDQPRFLVAYLILRRIQRVADVLGTLPTMADIESGLCEGGMAVIFSPRDPKPGLIDQLGENLKSYYGVSRFNAATFA